MPQATRSVTRFADLDDAEQIIHLGGLQQMVIVAKSGGDFDTIQAAIDSITDASSSKHYIILVCPGIYTEDVILKDFVFLYGFGAEYQLNNTNMYFISRINGKVTGQEDSGMIGIGVIRTDGGICLQSGTLGIGAYQNCGFHTYAIASTGSDVICVKNSATKDFKLRDCFIAAGLYVVNDPGRAVGIQFTSSSDGALFRPSIAVANTALGDSVCIEFNSTGHLEVYDPRLAVTGNANRYSVSRLQGTVNVYGVMSPYYPGTTVPATNGTIGFSAATTTIYGLVKQAADVGAAAGWADATAQAWANSLRDNLRAVGIMA